MRRAAYRNFRIDARLAARAERIATDLGRLSANAVIEACVEEMLDLVEQAPHERHVPKLALLVDELRSYAQNPPRLPPPVSNRPVTSA
ncbi:MAG: hypothetical protein HS113_03280 [Verrucomicrobiales bacterium]|nr:hypothetical protein [Verrucomicrobiales bacterium]